MKSDFNIDVATLDGPQRRAFEELIGQTLSNRQRLNIRIEQSCAPDLVQTLEQWLSIYDGLSEKEIEAIDVFLTARSRSVS